jgi:hypothetical protein
MTPFVIKLKIQHGGRGNVCITLGLTALSSEPLELEMSDFVWM